MEENKKQDQIPVNEHTPNEKSAGPDEGVRLEDAQMDEASGGGSIIIYPPLFK